MAHGEYNERLFNTANVLVLLHKGGTINRVAEWGMRHGLPIISARVDGVYEQLRDYEGVMWIDPGDDFALTQWLYTLVCDNRRKVYPIPERLT